VKLRPVAPSDLVGLSELCRDHAAYEGMEFVECGHVNRWHSALFGEAPRLFGWVCTKEEQGALMGYMTATVDYSTWSARPFVYLDCLYLRPEARRGGVGRALMDALAKFANSRGCAEIQWQTPPTNELGLGFYRTISARELPKIRFTLTVEGRSTT